MKYFKHISVIFPVFCLILAACGGSAIGDAQEFSPNEPPSIISIKAVNFDGTEITQLDIEPYKQFKLIIEAIDPDNNPLEYKFDSASGTFSGISSNPKGCTAVFKTGSIKGGQNIELWAMVSDGKGALVRQSFNLGTGKLGPAITAVFDRIIFKPNESVKLSVTANCSGFFQLNCDGNKNFDFEKDMYRYSYGPNKTTDFILGGPEFISYADIQLQPRADNKYTHETVYNLVLVFRDGLFQTCDYGQTIYVDGTPPRIADEKGFTPADDKPASTDPEVVVNFNENIGYADSSSLTLEPAGGTIKLKSINVDKAVFSVSGLKSLTPYTATISGIKDIAGNVMVPDSTNSFTTKYSGSSNFIVYDKSAGMSFTSYCGFVNKEFQLSAEYEGKPINDFINISYSSSRSDLVSVSSKGLIAVQTIALDNIDEEVTITAKYLGETAMFTVKINSYYPVTKADEFGQGGIINQNLNGRFKLAVDEINFGGAEVSPIGSSAAFTGFFDGNGKTLSNFKIKDSSEYASLFGQNNGIIKNLTVDSATNNNGTTDYVGIICGHNKGGKDTNGNYKNGIISNCHVINPTLVGNKYVSGIAGLNEGEISGCSVKGGSISTPTSNMQESVGGITGVHCGKLISCYNDGTKVTGKINVGGLIGYSFEAIITVDDNIGPMYAKCNVTGGSSVGGIIGYFNTGTIKGLSEKYIFSEGTVKGYSNTGGLIGSFTGDSSPSTIDLQYCKSSETVSSMRTVSPQTSDVNFGGLIGNLSNGNVKNCSSSGTIDCGNVFDNIGGLIGYANLSTIESCSSTGDIINGSYSGLRFVGGLIGSFHGDGNNDTIDLQDCNSSGNVLKDNTVTTEVGGLIGFSVNGVIENCHYENGFVGGENAVGGLIGSLKDGTVDYCSNIKAGVTGDSNVGGLIGYVYGNAGGSVTISNSHVRLNVDDTVDITGRTIVGGLIGLAEGKRTDSKYSITVNCCSATGNCLASNNLNILKIN